MVVIEQAVKSAATRRPMIRDRKELPQFAELHALPSSWACRMRAQRKPVRLPRMDCKSPLRGVARVHGSGAAARRYFGGAAVRNGGHGRRLGVGRVRRVLRMNKRAGGGVDLKVGDVAAKKVGGEKEVRWSTGRCRWPPAECPSGRCRCWSARLRCRSNRRSPSRPARWRR